jgi:hypothetical protein
VRALFLDQTLAMLERDDWMITGIEVKASATVKARDFVGMRALAVACGDRLAVAPLSRLCP